MPYPLSPNPRISQFVLGIAAFLCIALCAYRLGEFIAQHIPPYQEGICLQPNKPELKMLMVKIEKNHLLDAYSEMGVYYLGYRMDSLEVTFDDERNAESKFTKVDCDLYERK